MNLFMGTQATSMDEWLRYDIFLYIDYFNYYGINIIPYRSIDRNTFFHACERSRESVNHYAGKNPGRMIGALKKRKLKFILIKIPFHSVDICEV